MTMRNRSTLYLLHSRRVWLLISYKISRFVKCCARINSQHFVRATSNNCRLILSVSWLGQIVFQRGTGQILITLFYSVLSYTLSALLILHLLHIIVSCHLISIIVKILIYLLFAAIFLTCSYLNGLTIVVVQGWVDPNLVVQHWFVFPVLDAHFLGLIMAIINLYWSLSHVILLNDGSTFLWLKRNITNFVIYFDTIATVYGMFKRLSSYLWSVLTTTLLMICGNLFFSLDFIKETLSRGMIETTRVANVL